MHTSQIGVCCAARPAKPGRCQYRRQLPSRLRGGLGGYRPDRGELGDTAPAIRTGRSPARTAHRIAFTTQSRKAVPHGNYIGQMGYMWNNGLHCNCIGQTTNVEVCGTMGYIATTLDKWDTLWNT